MKKKYLSNKDTTKLCVLALLEAALDSLESVAGQMPDKERGEAAVLVMQTTLAVKRAQGEAYDKPMDQWANGELRRFSYRITALQEVVRDAWEKEVNAIEFLASVLMLVAWMQEHVEEHSTSAGEKLVWGVLHDMASRVYEIFDPDLVAMDAIDRGFKVGEKFQKAMQSVIAA